MIQITRQRQILFHNRSIDNNNLKQLSCLGSVTQYLNVKLVLVLLQLIFVDDKISQRFHHLYSMDVLYKWNCPLQLKAFLQFHDNRTHAISFYLLTESLAEMNLDGHWYCLFVWMLLWIICLYGIQIDNIVIF